MKTYLWWTVDHAQGQYVYWSTRARQHAETFGRESEIYRASAQMAHRWLGRWDVLAALENV